MGTTYSITEAFGANLAEIIATKIANVYPSFESKKYIQAIEAKCTDLSYTQRIILHAQELRNYLPSDYVQAVNTMVSILGEENPSETGMFTNYYWIMPIGKFIELYGLEDFDVSIKAIEEVTKRNTGEYTIRPFIRKYPTETMSVMNNWSKSKNFHLRRLASEGCRPKLPWSTKLDEFIERPEPVFEILRNLMDDEIKFVQKSVANNLTDYLKVNKPAAAKFIQKFQNSTSKNTIWIIKHATRKISID